MLRKGRSNLSALAALLAALLAQPGAAQIALAAPQQAAPAVKPPTPLSDDRPYDAQLFRLAEILGAVHYLRELCGASEGQVWREQMREIVTSEGTSALRRAKLVESFNRGYRGYSRTYRTCTPPARVAIQRFMEQGAAIAEALVANDK